MIPALVSGKQSDPKGDTERERERASERERARHLEGVTLHSLTVQRCTLAYLVISVRMLSNHSEKKMKKLDRRKEEGRWLNARDRKRERDPRITQNWIVNDLHIDK
jgi:hypothetical protein